MRRRRKDKQREETNLVTCVAVKPLTRHNRREILASGLGDKLRDRLRIHQGLCLRRSSRVRSIVPARERARRAWHGFSVIRGVAKPIIVVNYFLVGRVVLGCVRGRTAQAPARSPTATSGPSSTPASASCSRPAPTGSSCTGYIHV